MSLFLQNAESSKLIYTVDDIDLYLAMKNCSIKDCFFYLELKSNKIETLDNFILPYSMKKSNIGHPNIQVTQKFIKQFVVSCSFTKYKILTVIHGQSLPAKHTKIIRQDTKNSLNIFQF